MNIEKMTTKGQESVREAFNTASRKGNPEIHPEHLCLAVVEQDGGVGRPLVQKAGGDYAALVSALEARIESCPQQSQQIATYADKPVCCPPEGRFFFP